MKANELVIGDWVYSSFYYNSTKPCRITGIRTFDIKDVYASVYIDKVEDIKDINSLTPIPLTPEILEKNGFVVESRDCHGGPLQYCILVDGLWIDISGENYFEGKLEYIHQLQHTLRLCGIDKTIEL